MSKSIAIIMGSDSDWPVMQEAGKILDEFGVSYSAEVLSAHRMPEEMSAFAKSAASKGYSVIIAGAGGEALRAHLDAWCCLAVSAGDPI